MDLLSFFKKNLKTICIAFVSSVFLGFARRYFLGPIANKKDLLGKVIIVTGASEGIGLPTAIELLKSGAKVIFACRNKEKTEKIITKLDKKLRENAYFIQIDLSSFKSVKDFCEQFKKQFGKLDILINNAGMTSKNHQMTIDNIEQTLQVNTFSNMVLTEELLPLFNDQGRIINVSAKLYSIIPFKPSILDLNWQGKENYSQIKQYAFSKVGINFFTKFLTLYFKKENLNIKAFSLHPGVIKTELSRDVSILLKTLFLIFYPFFMFCSKSPFRGAQTTLHLCYEDFFKLKSGEYYSDCDVKGLAKNYTQPEYCLSYIEWSREIINDSGKSSGVKFNLNI